jgi:enoyl-CoA hydratase
LRSFEHLRIATGPEGVVIATLDRAPVNAVNVALYGEIAEFFAAPDSGASNVCAIVLTGAGRHFCAGNDLDEFASMTGANGSERMWRVREAFFAIQDCPVPVIGAINGSALGTGLAIAASCDFVVAAATARFGLPELSVGVMGGARHLARMAPQPLVRRMFLTGEHLTAVEFASLGGCVMVCDAGELMEEAKRHAARIASFSPTAVRLGKQILNRIETMELQAGYEFEQGYTVKMSDHPDSKEALAAFREKRAPRFAARNPSWTI